MLTVSEMYLRIYLINLIFIVKSRFEEQISGSHKS